MSKTITQANLTANAEKTYAIDDFPSMVNYANTKNKGYVRFTMNGYGKLSIQKFNNKLDVPLSWRSNVKPEHNKAVRALDFDLSVRMPFFSSMMAAFTSPTEQLYHSLSSGMSSFLKPLRSRIE